MIPLSNLTSQAAVANCCEAMEPETISKNGTIPKIRGDILKIALTAIVSFISFGAIDAQTARTQVEPQVQPSAEKGKALKRRVAIARFTNETAYGKGIFYDKNNDPMAKQALDILSTRLAATEKFILLERSDIDKAMMESDQEKPNVPADFIIVGSITEYGRKNIGQSGVFSNTKTQTVEAGVSIRLIDVSSGLIIYSEEAKGSAETSSKTTMGIGGSADFDASLSDKAISAAISQLTENIINNCMNRAWKAYFLAVDEGVYYVSGGASQGLSAGDKFTVKEKGKSVKNPQTGMMMELPGKTAGKIRISLTGGDSVESEFSIAEFTEGQIDESKLSNYFIVEEE
ncbi:MAG: CsgG/HfaB family protein [Bacteroidales bacterium]|jgi:curli biogenesis system outer membrane secretion channel CsgG|nr:CsgG/HfaB family protein [Bacteroidales bacterium]